MRKLPAVDVLMPAFNHEEYVAAAVESVLEQTYPNIRLIAVDDCSSDATPEVIQRYAREYPDKVLFLRHTENRGVSNTWNSALSFVSGGFLAPFASDDILPPAAVERRVEFMLDHPEVDVLVTDFHAIGPSGNICVGSDKFTFVPQFERIYRADWDRIYEELLLGNFIPGGTVLIRLEKVKKRDLIQDPLCPNLSDYDLWLRLARDQRWTYLGASTLVYRWHGMNLSSPGHSWNTPEIVDSQTIYILSKHLLTDQTDSQRELTLKMLHLRTSSLLGRLIGRRPSLELNAAGDIR